MRKHLIYGLLATALAGPAWAQSNIGSPPAFGMSGNYGAGVPGSGSSQDRGSLGSSYGTGSANAGTSAFSIQGNGLPAGVSGLPGVDASDSGSGSGPLAAPGSGAAPGLGIGPSETRRRVAPRM